MKHAGNGFLSFTLRALFVGALLIVVELSTGGLRREADGLRAKIDNDQCRIDEGAEALADEVFSAQTSLIADEYLSTLLAVPEGAIRSAIIHDRLQVLARRHMTTIEHAEEIASYQQLETSCGVTVFFTTHRGWAHGDFDQVAAWLNDIETANPGFRVVAFSIQPLSGELLTRRVRVEFTVSAGSLTGQRSSSMVVQAENGA
jgi:hypothetical protein